jgi:hypothetical protein
MSLAVESKPHAAYVERLRRRLAKPIISSKDARDGVLECFVATYHEGLSAGLQGVLGVQAGPDEVARLAAGMFRTRLANHGSTFEEPSVEALARVKAEVDEELHFGKLPIEIQATHDRVCDLLLAKAEGSLPHAGDHSSVVGPRAAASTAPTLTREPARPPSVLRPVPPPPAAPATAYPATPLREAVATLFEELAAWTRKGRSMTDVHARLAKAARLIDTVQELESP